jgi:uncharacterized membrane protein YfcA
MKTISTFVSLFLILTTAVTSAVLYLNEHIALSAGLCVIWIISLTYWIGSAVGMQLMDQNKQVAQNA